MANWTSLSDLLESRLGDANHSALDHLVSRDHQNKIALSITDWRSIAPFLGLEETDEEDIKASYSTVKTRNIATLRKWKHLHGSSATYRRLLGAFWDVERIDLIDKLLEMFAADTPLSPAQDQVTIETKDNETMIYVKTLSGQRIVLEVISTDTVEDLKTMFLHKLPVEERVESKKLRLIFQGQELSDERLLCEYGIQNHSTVYQRLQMGTIQLCISLPDLGKFLPLTVKPATTFFDIVHRVVAFERTLLPYQHLLVTLRGRNSVKLAADKYASVVGDYNLKCEDTVELVACERYCHSLQVTVSHVYPCVLLAKSQPPEPKNVTLKLHSHNTFRTVETLLCRPQCDACGKIYTDEVVLKREEVVGLIRRCSVDLKPVFRAAAADPGTRMFGTEVEYGEPRDLLENKIPLIFRIEKKVGNKKVAIYRPSGSAVVYIDQKDVPLYLPDSDVSVFIVKELMRERSQFQYYDRKVQLFQNDLKLTDDTMLSECASTKVEYNGSTILTYHFTSEYSKQYSVCYLKQPSQDHTSNTILCRVHVFSSDTIADLKAAIEESSGIPQQNQALYDCDFEHKFGTWYDVSNSRPKLKLHDHQVVQDFVHHGRFFYGNVYLDVRLLVVIKTPGGVTIPFEVLSCDNVLSLKRMITIETDIPVADQNLLSDDTVLEDAKSVGAYIENMKLKLHCTLVVSSKSL